MWSIDLQKNKDRYALAQPQVHYYSLYSQCKTTQKK